MVVLTEAEQDILRNCKFFNGCRFDLVISLITSNDQIIKKHLSENDTLFRISEAADNIGLILHGAVAVHKLMANGAFINIAKKTAGDLLGEAAVYALPGKYPCEVIAVDECDILLIPREIFTKILASDEKLLSNFLSELATMTYALQSRVEMLSYSSIASKIAYFLLSQMRTCGKNEIKIPENMTNMAQILHVSRTSMHREMKELVKAGAIELKEQNIRILNKEYLEQLLQ